MKVMRDRQVEIRLKIQRAQVITRLLRKILFKRCRLVQRFSLRITWRENNRQDAQLSVTGKDASLMSHHQRNPENDLGALNQFSNRFYIKITLLDFALSNVEYRDQSIVISYMKLCIHYPVGSSSVMFAFPICNSD